MTLTVFARKLTGKKNTRSDCMNKTGIWYFSGTGNTALVADMIAEGLRQRGASVAIEEIHLERGKKAKPNTDGLDAIGIGSPVIGFGTPWPIMRFVRALPPGNGKKAFVFKTAGGVVTHNYPASRTLIRLLEKKGYEVCYERIFSIGSNWIVRFSNGTMRTLYNATRIKADRMASELLEGKRRRLAYPARLGFMMAAAHVLSGPVLKVTSRMIRVSDSCTGCGICAVRCPASNVSMKGTKPRFGFSCTTCMRCIYGCPEKALTYSGISFFAVKGGYDVKRILEHPGECPDAGSNETPAFMAEYIQNADL